MAEKKGKNDSFANIAFLTATESAAGTLTFAKIDMASPMMGEKYALVIHRAESIMSNIHSQFNSTADTAYWALTVSDRLTSIQDLSQPEILFMDSLLRADFGAAASGLLVERPILHDFTSLPGGGLLVPADRLSLGVYGSGLAAALTVSMRVYYTVMPLATDQYWELIEARRVMTT